MKEDEITFQEQNCFQPLKKQWPDLQSSLQCLYTQKLVSSSSFASAPSFFHKLPKDLTFHNQQWVPHR